MGVSGLFMYCSENRNQVADRVDLLQLIRQSRRGRPIEILVDFYAFESYVLPKVTTKCSPLNPSVRIFGGEYEAYDQFIQKFLKTLKSLGIRFVFFIDSSRGSSPDIKAHKLETWKQRFVETLGFYQEIGQVCRREKSIHNLRDKLVRPCLLTVQTLASILDAGCEIVPCLYGEADSFISFQLQQRPDAFAVFSHDSDFMVMKGCRLIPIDWFDLNGDLINFLNAKGDKVVGSLMVDVVTPEKVAFSLGLPSAESLVEVSILKGNDFTRPFLKNMNLRSHLGIRNFTVQSFATWVARNGTLEKSDFLWHSIRTDKEFQSAVNHSRQFYSNSLPLVKPQAKDPQLTQLIETGISGGEYPMIFLAMHHSFYWHREIVMDVSQGVANVEVALKELRRMLYDMILPNGEKVLEFYRDDQNKLRSEKIPPKKEFASLTLIKKMSEEERLRIFASVWQKFESEDRIKNHFQSFNFADAFLIFILRFFLNLNFKEEATLNVAAWEMEALLTSICHVKSPSVFGSPSSAPKDLVPSLRCITIYNWVQEIYLYGYNLFAKALGISHLFPAPCQLFCGSVFVRYFMAREFNQDISQNSSQLDVLRNKIMKENFPFAFEVMNGFFSDWTEN